MPGTPDPQTREEVLSPYPLPRSPSHPSQALKSALWLAIGRLVDATTLRLGTNATPQFIAALTEATWAQIEGAAADAQRFARHRGARDVRVEDVLLLARRNEGLEGVMRARLEGAVRARETGR